MSTAPPALASDLEAGLRCLRLSAIRALSPELLVTAKTQRWKPKEFLRILIEAEIASRDASNAANRLKVASFPVTKTLDEFDVAASSVKPATFAYLSGLEWVRAKENPCLVCTAGTGKSHLLVALGARLSKPDFASATSAQSSWSRPSIAGWPRTRPAGSSRGSSEQT
jgi:DNA replication protein DnaC